MSIGKLRIWLFLTENDVLFEDADTTPDTVGDEWCVTAVSALRLSSSERESSQYKSQDTSTALNRPHFPESVGADELNCLRRSSCLNNEGRRKPPRRTF